VRADEVGFQGRVSMLRDDRLDVDSGVEGLGVQPGDEVGNSLTALGTGTTSYRLIGAGFSVISPPTLLPNRAGVHAMWQVAPPAAEPDIRLGPRHLSACPDALRRSPATLVSGHSRQGRDGCVLTHT
jgi:hypothetical protein